MLAAMPRLQADARRRGVRLLSVVKAYVAEHIRAYYRENQHEFKSPETAVLQYVLFDKNPSLADEEEVRRFRKQFAEPRVFFAISQASLSSPPLRNEPYYGDSLYRQLDEQVIKAGGRVYLAKDARLNRDSFNAMYPRIDEWREIKKKIDPENRFTSSMARRLGMVQA